MVGWERNEKLHSSCCNARPRR